MNHAISLADASQIVNERRAGGIVRSFSLAQQAWSSQYPQEILDEQARGRIIYNHFYYELARELSWDDGMKIGVHAQQQYVAFDERVSLRIKHFGRHLRGRNYPTQHANAWTNSSQQLPLMAGMARLDFGYRLDLTGNLVRDAFVTLPNGRSKTVPNHWVWQVLGDPLDTTVFGTQAAFGVVDPGDVYRYDDLSRWVA